jgi:signal transduction histidine kinase
MKRPYLYAFFLALCAVSIFSHVVEELFWSTLRIFYEPLHSTVEAMGAVAAVIMATFLLQRRGEAYGGKFFMVAMGFLGMGILDGFHAVSEFGEGFVLLHSMATFAGGFWFALIWLKGFASDEEMNWRRGVLWIVVAASIVIGLMGLFAKGALPAMVHEGAFTTIAIALNFIGGVLFIVAAVRFLMDFHHSGKFSAYLLACLAVLFGMAGINFQYSAPWDVEWWFWHTQRLLAYTIVLGWVVYEHQYVIVEVKTKRGLEAINRALKKEIIERTRAEDEVRKLNDELDLKVQEKTKQLLAAQEALVRKEKLAVLGQIASSVGHELRNPLGVMSNAVFFLHTMLSDADETIREYLGIIKDEITVSERIISALLDAVRTNPPHPERMGVAQLIEQTLNKYIVPPFVTVKLDIPATLPPLQVDSIQIHQVFRNLISNSVEAMPEGGVLEIGAVENRQERTITIRVRDNGAGIAPEVMEKLFQPLFSTKARGIGLGLVVVKNLVEANGGTATVQSEVGIGTTFTVTLPTDDVGF